MAAARTPEESGKQILVIFKRHNVKTGEILMAGSLNSEFLMAGGTASEYGDGIKFAIAENWIEIEPKTVRLKEAGFAAM